MSSQSSNLKRYAAIDFDTMNNSLPPFEGEPAAKKPRFDVRNPSALAPDAPEEDVTLDADVIGGRGQKIRRGAVNIDGYDSDSDNENFDARAAARTKAQKATQAAEEEDENDMFADLEAEVGDNNDNEKDSAGKQKKGVKFLGEDDIEGQVRTSKSGGHVSADFSLNGKGKGRIQDESQESSDDSETEDVEGQQKVDEEVGAGGKKTHAPKLDAFNMRNENEEGRFDEHGNYVRKAADPDSLHDAWLEGISKKEMKKANEAHDKREKERREKAIEDDSKSESDMLNSLLPLLQPTETVLEALARLNKAKMRKGKWQGKIKRKPSEMENTEETEKKTSSEEKAEEQRSNAIMTITEAADLLLARGQSEIYHTEKELLVRRYRQVTGEEWIESSNNQTGVSSMKEWQYRWSDGRDGSEIHGPYDTATIKAWIDAGYFDENVEYRNGEDDSWSRQPELI